MHLSETTATKTQNKYYTLSNLKIYWFHLDLIPLNKTIKGRNTFGHITVND